MIHTFVGDNIYERKQAVNKLVSAFRVKYGDLAIERFDAEESEAQSILDALQNNGLFTENKLVIVRNFSANIRLIKKLEHIISSIDNSIELLLIDTKLDKRASYFKLLQKSTDYQEFIEKKPAGVLEWAKLYAASIKATLSSRDAQHLIDRIGPNQALLAQEIEKLALFNPTITRQSIELLTDPTPQSTVFQLLDAAFSGDKKRVLKLYDEQRAQRVEPQAILGMIAWQLHVLALVKTAEQQGITNIAQQTKLSPFVVQKSRSTIQKLSLAKLKDLLYKAHKLDVRLKSQPIDSDDAICYFLIAHIATN